MQDQLLGLEKKRFKFPWIVYIQPKNNFLQMIRDRENSPLFNKASSLTPPYDPFFYSLMLGYYNSLKDRLDERILFLDNDRDVEENCLKAEKWIQSRETPWPEINMWELFY